MEKFLSETEAKAKWKKEALQIGWFDKVFYIETEETEEGFPDVIAVKCEEGGYNNTVFFEFKVTDKRDRIKFQRSQPAWYIRNKILTPTIVIWHNRLQKFIYLPSMLAVEQINDRLEIQL